jgi:hypothetical protein
MRCMPNCGLTASASRRWWRAACAPPFLLERFPELDAAALQDPDDVADAIRSVLLLPPSSVVAELTILPLRETSWP